MFGIGIPEIIVIMVIALFVIGPEKLPEIAKMLGKTLAEFKKVVDGVKSSVEEEEAEIKKSVDLTEEKMSLSEKSAALAKEYEEASGEKKDENDPKG